MSNASERNNMAVLSIVGAPVDQLVASRVIDGGELAQRLEDAASAHGDAGRADVGDTIRWLSRALLDEETLRGLSVNELPSSN
jgi:hypothetical protein